MANKLSFDINMNTAGYVQGARQAQQSTKDLEKSTNKYLKEFGSLRKELAAAKKEAQNLAMEFSQLSKTERESEIGKQMAQDLDIAIEKAAELQDVMGDTNAAIKNLASDTSNLDAITQGLSILGNTISGAANAYAALTGDSKAAKQALTTFAAVQSTVNALTAISNALENQTILLLKLRKIGQIAMNVQTAIAQARQEGYNIALAIGKALLGDWKSLLMAVVVALGGYSLIMKLVGDEQEELNDETEEAAKKTEEYKKELRDIYNQTAGKLLTTYIKLQAEWNRLNTEAEKANLIEEYKNEIKSLGVEINNVADAQRLFNEGAKDFEEAVINQAAAAVLAKRMQDEVAKAMDVGQDDWKYGMFIEKAKEYAREGAKFKAAATEILGELSSRKTGGGNNTDSSIKKIAKEAEYATDSIADLEAKLSTLQRNQKNGINVLSAEDYQKQVKEIQDAIEAKKISLGISVVLNNDDLFNKYDEITKKFMTPLVPSLDFSGLSDEMQSEANSIVDEIDRIVEHIKELKELLGETSDNSFAYFLEGQINGLEGELGVLTDEAQRFAEESEKIRALNDYMTKEAAKRREIFDSLASAADSLGSALSTIGDMSKDKTLNVAGVIAQTLANIAMSFSEALLKESKWGVWNWIAAGAAGLAQLVAMTAQIKSINETKGYAEGGPVPGSSFSGDRLLARVNSGEMIFNSRQQKRLYEIANGTGYIGNNTVHIIGTTKVNGSDLDIVWTNYNRINKRAR